MTADALRDKVARALADLGDRPQTVVAVLQAHGCTGTPRETEACPVSRYLRRLLGPETFVSVIPFNVLVTHPTTMVVVAMPRAVEAVIHAFDRRLLPALEVRHVAYRPTPGHRLLQTCPLPRCPVAMSVRQVGDWTMTLRHDLIGLN